MNAIEVQIREEGDGAYYPMSLTAVPRVGDMICLESRLDASTGNEPDHSYQVTRVVHKLVHANPNPDEGQPKRKDQQTVLVYVMPLEKVFES